MTLLKLLRRSVRHHRRMHLAVAAGTAVATAAIVGALAVGDSVRGTLREATVARLGGTHLALAAGSRLFRAELARKLATELHVPVVPVIHLEGAASSQERRANRVHIYGVDHRFWKLTDAAATVTENSVILNGALARKLSATPGGEVRLHIRKLSAVPADAPLSGKWRRPSRTLLTVAGVSDNANFSLLADQAVPLNAFVPLSWLADKLGRPGRANMLLVGGGISAPSSARANAALAACTSLADLQLEIRSVGKSAPGLDRAWHELRTSRVFLAAPVAAAARAVRHGARGVLTYFVNELRAGPRSTPYSTVAGLEPGAGPLPHDMGDDDIVVNAWLAKDLAVKGGDRITLTYFALGPAGGLIERSRSFRVRGRPAPIESPGADRTLMPHYPGLTDVEDCRRWKPGIEIDTTRIRPIDEEYWDDHRGAPKAYVALAAAQEMWANRFGTLTAVRWPAGAPAVELAEALSSELDPAAAGLSFQPVRRRNLRAAREGQNFAGLFLAMSLFLIVAALLLIALLFSLGVSGRAHEAGLLLALGFTPARVRGVFLAEAALPAVGGAIVGAGGGLLQALAVLGGLRAIWQDAQGGIGFHLEWATVLAGPAVGVAVACGTMWLALRWRIRRPPRDLLAGVDTREAMRRPGGRGGRLAFRAALATAVAWPVVLLLGHKYLGQATAFFLVGAMLLGVGVLAAAAVLARAAPGAGALTAWSLARRNAARRITRSLGVVGALACGCFLVVAVGANRLQPPRGDPQPSDGRGGFDLYIETALPATAELTDEAPGGAAVVPLRVRPGDQANCLNLGRTSQPRLLGVRGELLAGRFSFLRAIDGAGGWGLLDADAPAGVVPAVGDEPTVRWALGKDLGDTLTFTDEAGGQVKVRIVGVIAGSILQGGLIVSEERFTAAWPSRAGYRAFLVDAQPEAAAAAGEALRRHLQDVGADVERTGDRLAAFNHVENVYMSIFGLLGALGLLLGSAGLGVLVAYNVMARRAELAVMRAVGFERAALRGLVLAEHWLLLALGLAAGLVAGLVAVAPAMLAAYRPVAVASLAVVLGCIVAAGVLWIWLAGAAALRGDLLVALRNE